MRGSNILDFFLGDELSLKGHCVRIFFCFCCSRYETATMLRQNGRKNLSETYFSQCDHVFLNVILSISSSQVVH